MHLTDRVRRKSAPDLGSPSALQPTSSLVGFQALAACRGGCDQAVTHGQSHGGELALPLGVLPGVHVVAAAERHFSRRTACSHFFRNSHGIEGGNLLDQRPCLRAAIEKSARRGRRGH